MSLDMDKLLDAVRQVESGGRTDAVSPKGAQGPYQFMPGTAKQYGVSDPFDEAQARDGARRYMQDLLDQNNGDLSRALVAWNWGPGNLSKKGMSQMPAESRNFLAKVISHYGTPPESDFTADGLFPTSQPVSPLDALFPGTEGLRRQAAGELFPNNHENDALRAAVLQTDASADKASRVYKMQLRTGLPTAVIERNLDEIEQRAKREDFDAEAFRSESPLLAEWLAANPNRATLAQDDYESLSALEKSWSAMKAIPAGFEQGYKKERMLILSSKAAFGEISPQEELERKQLKTEMGIMDQQYSVGIPSWTKAAADIVGIQVPLLAESGRRGVTYGLPTGVAAGAALGALGGPVAPGTVPPSALAGGIIGFKMTAGATYIEQSYRLAVGEAYDDLTSYTDVNGEPLDPTVARYASMIVAAPNSLLEFASLRSAIKLIPGSERLVGTFTTGALKQVLTRPSVKQKLAEFAGNYAAAVGTETFTEGMQKFLTILAGEVASGDMGEGLGMEDLEAVAAESGAAFKGSAVLGALASGPKVIELYADVQKAEQNQAFMEDLGDIVSNSKTFSKSPQAMRDYINYIKKDGPIQNVFIPVDKWDLLFQDRAPDAAMELFGNLDQYSQAQVHGGDLVIPIETYAEKLAPTEFHQMLVPHTRLAPGELTPTEASEIVQAEPELAMKLQMEAEETQARELPLAAIYNDVFDKLRTIGMSSQEANRDATLWRERLRSRAERLGIDPLQLYQENPLTVQREYPAEIVSKLAIYNQQLAEPAVPSPQRLTLEGGEINLPEATSQEQGTALEALAAAQYSQEQYGVFGATVHPDRGNLAGQEGVAVAGYPQRGVVTDGAPSQADIETFMRRNRDIFTADKNAALGIWVDNESGKGYLDITNVLPRDLAIAQGEQLGELAVWDLGASEEIRLPTAREDLQQVLFQSAYHGSANKFEKFLMDKIGSGEGAQAYGWGLYFADRKEIAEWYREKLANASNNPWDSIFIDGQSLRDWAEKDPNVNHQEVDALEYVAKALIFRAQTQYNIKANWDEDVKAAGLYFGKDNPRTRMVRDIFADLQAKDITFRQPNTGQLYKVELPENDELMLWEKPLSEQPEKVKQALLNILGGDDLIWRSPEGEWNLIREGELPIYEKFSKKEIGKIMTRTEAVLEQDRTGMELYDIIASNLRGEKNASEALANEGVRGHKFLDATSRNKGEGTYNYVVYDEDAINISETFYQGERGASIPSKNIIAILKNADPSTFLHESGHVWLEELRADAMRLDAPAQLKADWETVKKWTGATNKKISRDAHEKFARGVESYIMEGKAPSLQLREIVAQFKDWLVRIYKNLSALNVELTSEVRDVMDRLLATDEAIQFLHEKNVYHDYMLDESMMTEQEFVTYRALNETAKRVAEESFRAKVMKELRREKLDTWRQEKKELTPKVRDEFLEMPIYRAAYWLYNGALPDGTTFEDVPTLKLDKQSLLDLGVTLTDLPFRYQENGLHPDIVAELFGFSSGESFVKELVDLKPLTKAVEEEVSNRMRSEHGDLLMDGNFMDQAGMEVQNTQQIDVFNMELRILKRLGAKREAAHPAMMKDLARGIVSRQKLNQLDPRVYEAAALKAAQEADEAMLGQEFRTGTGRNLDKAFDAKQRQMLNVYLFREASEQVANYQKQIRKWKKFLTRSDKRLAPYYNMDMVNAARAIVATHGLGGTQETATSYMNNLASYDPQTYSDLKDIVELASSDGRKMDELTVADFALVADAVEGLWTMARRTRQIEIDGQKMERDQVVGELNGRIEELAGGQRNRAGYNRAVSDWQKTKMGFLGLRAMLRRVEHWVDAMDDGNPKGVFRSYVWQPISEAADQYRDARRVMLEKYSEIAKSVPKETFKLGKISAPEIGYEFTNKTELIGALLHTGNMSNLQKLLRGRSWGAFTPEGELDSRRWDSFIQRMWNEGVITKNDYDFVQQVWDLLDEVKPLAQKAHKDMYGYYFDEVTAQPIKTPFGVYKGGYYPAIVDSFMVEDASIRAEQEALEGRPTSFMFPTTGRGFTRKRAEAYAKPLSLDLGLIPQHLQKVLRFSYLEPHIKDVGRVAIDRNFREKLAGLDSEVGAVMLMPWLQRSALQLVEQPSGPRMRQFDSFFYGVRTRTGMQLMAANVSVALQQVTGLGLAAVKVKPRYLAGALWNMIRNPINYSQHAKASSTFMRNRVTSQLMDIQQSIDNIVLNPSKYQKAKQFAAEHAFFMQTWMQSFVDQVAWGGAYEQAVQSGATEKEAVRQADSVVRETQGTFSAEDISRIEAGPAYLRVFTMFYSFFNMAANLNGTEFTKALRRGGFNAGGRALYVYAMGFMVPAVIGEAITQMMAGQLFDDDDEDGYLDNLLSVFFGGQARMATAMVPVLGSVAQAGINQFNNKWYDDRISTSPAVSTLEASARVPYDVYRLATDESARLKRPIQDVFTMIGLATGMPVAPLARPIGYLTDVEQGVVEASDNPLETARGLISGKAQR